MRKIFLLLLLFFCISECCISQTITTTYTYKWKYDTVYTAGGVGTKDYSYIGNYATYSAAAGTYTFEVWGAQGGDAIYSSGYGGKGGYSKGTLTLTSPATLYIYVGGAGAEVSGANVANGGFNGGGGLYTDNGGATGGGASDIRIGSTSLYARVIVAGGGAGGAWDGKNGGYGGGLTGGTGDYWNGYAQGSGGTQTSGGTHIGSLSGGGQKQSVTVGTFGTGGVGSGSSSGGSGGGGGWYGGAGGLIAGGGGGSGYVYTSSTASSYPAGCLLSSACYLTSANTYAGNVSFASTAGYTETGHSGNGYARISYNTKILDHIDTTIAYTYATTTITDVTCAKGYYNAFGFNLKCDTLSAGVHTYKLSYHPSADKDSTVILQLNVKAEILVFEEVECPAPYVWPVTGLSYSESGIYSVHFQSENGCDSTITLALTIVSTAGISNEDNLGLKVYPNPASEYVEVVIENNSVSEFFLYDISGHLIKKELLENSQNRISLRSIPSGIYLMKFCGDKGTVCKKLVINQ